MSLSDAIVIGAMADEYDRERFPGNFYSGIIVRLDRARGRGVVRSNSGRDIMFQFPYVSIVGAAIGGPMPGIEMIREGARVGFDVGWTSKGLRVTRIKSEEPPDPPRSTT